MYYAYVIYSSTHHKIYIGYSSNPEGRLAAHNHTANKGWTQKYQPWELVHTESFQTKAEAQKREKQLKSYQGRQFIWKEVIGIKY